jgi:hypothetical protein
MYRADLQYVPKDGFVDPDPDVALIDRIGIVDLLVLDKLTRLRSVLALSPRIFSKPKIDNLCLYVGAQIVCRDTDYLQYVSS